MHVAISSFSLDGVDSLKPQNPVASEEILQICVQCVCRVHWLKSINVRWPCGRRCRHVAIANWNSSDKTASLSLLCFMISDNCSSNLPTLTFGRYTQCYSHRLLQARKANKATKMATVQQVVFQHNKAPRPQLSVSKTMDHIAKESGY